MALSLSTVTITDWYHQIMDSPSARNVKDIGYPNSMGMTYANLGKGNTRESAKKIVFQSEGIHHNCFKDTSAANIATTITNLLALTTPATLTIGTDTVSNMKLDQSTFNLIGPVKKILTGGTPYYIQEFTAVFVQYSQLT